MQSQVDAELAGVAELAEVEFLACGSRGDGEGVIGSIGEVAAPDAELQTAEVEVGMSAERSVEVLGAGQDC